MSGRGAKSQSQHFYQMNNNKYQNQGEVRLNPNDSRRPDKQDAHFRGSATAICTHCGKESLFWADLWINVDPQKRQAMSELVNQAVNVLSESAWMRCLLKERQPLANPEPAQKPFKHPHPEEENDVPF